MSQPAALNQPFIDLVAKDVRGLLDENAHKRLHSDKNLDGIYDALNALKKDVEVQLSNQKSRWVKKRHELNELGDDGSEWIAFRASEADWRARAIKFLMEVEDHLSAIKSRIKERNRLQNNSDPDLIDIILEHREEIGANEASLADERLWEKAEELRAKQSATQ